jgi:hypothetical protein
MEVTRLAGRLRELSSIMPQDFRVTNHGSIITIQPLTDEATTWLDENVEAEGWQWMGPSLCVEPRMAGALVDGIEEAGFSCGRAAQ